VKDIVAGPDGVHRCAWAHGNDLYEKYHDTEWGRPVHTDRGLFERISLEAFQSGLSWLVILRKRPAFRVAFAGFDIATVAQFTEDDRARLLDDDGIVRNRAKIDATILNARACVEMAEHGESLHDLLWSFAPPPRPAPRSLAEVPDKTDESTAMTAALKRRGFRFVGPTTCYALMQATGMVNDHIAGCDARERIAATDLV
jgi:DNA-3-methyladenine glycosylase I